MREESVIFRHPHRKKKFNTPRRVQAARMALEKEAGGMRIAFRLTKEQHVYGGEIARATRGCSNFGGVLWDE